MRCQLYADIGGAARPGHGRPAAVAFYDDDGGIVAAFERRALEAREIARCYLISSECWAAAAVLPHQAERLRVGSVAGQVRQFIDGDALRSGCQGHRESLNYVRGLVFLCDVELRVRHRPRRIIGGGGVRLGDPQRFVDAEFTKQTEIEAAQVVHRIRVEVDVQRKSVEVVVVLACH